MARTVLAALVSALSLWMGAKADCSFIQTCPQGPGCHPVPVEAPNNKPFLVRPRSRCAAGAAVRSPREVARADSIAHTCASECG